MLRANPLRNEIRFQIEQVSELRSLVRASGCSLVQIHTSSWIALMIAARLERKPLLVHVRELGHNLPRTVDLVYRLSLPVVATRLACDADFITRSFPAADWTKRRVRTLYNAEEFPDAAGLQASTDGVFTIGWAGRFAPRKGLDIFLKGAKALADKRPEVRFIIAGAPLEEEDLAVEAEARAFAEQHLPGMVTFLGSVQQMSHFYRLIDVLAFTSPLDIGPRVPIEAQCYGVPVVVTGLGGAREEVMDGQTGFVLDSARPEAIAHALIQLMDDPSLRERMSLAASSWARTAFGLEKYGASLRQLYAELVGTAASPRALS